MAVRRRYLLFISGYVIGVGKFTNTTKRVGKSKQPRADDGRRDAANEEDFWGFAIIVASVKRGEMT